MELTLIPKKVDFCGHFDIISVWSFRHVHFLKKQKQKQKPPENSLSGKTKLKQRSGGCQALSSIISILLTRRQQPRRAFFPRVPAKPLTQTTDFRFQVCWGPAKGIWFHVHSNPRRVKRRRGWIQTSRRSLGVASGHLGESKRSQQQAGWRRPWRSVRGGGADSRTAGKPGATAEVHPARRATLKPVPRTAPWRR